MTFLLIASIILCLCAFYDGYTTVKGIESGKLVEGNKLLDFIFRTDVPKPWQTYGIGYAIIAAEILLASELMKHVSKIDPKAWPFALLIQAAFHVVAAEHNISLEKD